MSNNFYNTLGVGEQASHDEVKKAYRTLQMKWHPDKNQGSPDSINMTQKINEAYETLGDEDKRKEYDYTRNNPNPFARMSSHGPNHNGGGMEVPIDDIFKMFFGGANPFQGNPFANGNTFVNGMQTGIPHPGGGRIHIFNGGPMNFQQAIQKPIPILKTITIAMEQVLTGASIPLEIERWILESGNKIFETETIYITVPQGIDDGEIIIERDRGNVINETSKGDVKIVIKIDNKTAFKRMGLDLIYDKQITLKEALCGFSFEINYIGGKSYTLNNGKGNIIPPEYKKVYPGMGLTRGEHKGNMIIHFHLEFPEKLTEEQITKLQSVL
jgi:DnaJ family protein B protein 4